MKRTHSSGAALVVTLCLLILLTICILAFMAIVRWDRQSASLTAATTRADLLGRSAGNLILADILAEIRDGSTNSGSSSAPVYSPLARQNVIPFRVLADSQMAANTNFANLFKQSAPASFYSGSRFTSDGPSRVSEINSSEPSRNGRLLSPQRWNKPQLLFASGFTTTNQIPSWVYLTRSESIDPAVLNPTNWSASLANAANSNFVIGRVAYNVYEIGGALDANVAGGFTGVAKAQLLSSLAGANLANIPGATNTASFVDWRNAVTGTSQQAFTTYAATNGLRAGFLDKVTGDRRFLGRQDLIAYARDNAGGGLSTNSLPYLTHFSRGLDRPSTQASTNAALLVGYLVRPAGLNPAPQTIKIDSDTLLPDGTAMRAGDPITFRRFPLRRISAITDDAVANKDNANAIYRQFGIYRATAGSPWTYDHGSETRILTLQEVKALGREPDFFEMLQAALNTGSLGGSGGPYNNASNPKYPTSVEALDENIYRQILTIGASIIDQYDTDDFATGISIKDGSGNVLTSFGIENLPYLNEIGFTPYRPAEKPRTKLRGYLQFEVWNPHQNARNANGTLQLRVAVTGGMVTLIPANMSYSEGTEQARFDTLYNSPLATAYSGSMTGPVFSGSFPIYAFQRGGTVPSGPGYDFTVPENQALYGVLEFKNGSQLQEPFVLTAPDDPATTSDPPFAYPVEAGGPTSTTSATSIIDEETPASLVLLNPNSSDVPPLKNPTSANNQLDKATQVRFAGIAVAEMELPDDRVDGRPDQMCWGEIATHCWCMLVPSIGANNPLRVELQVKTPSGWKPYQRISNILALSTSNRFGTYQSAGSLTKEQASSVSFIRPYVAIRKNTIPLYTGYNTMAAIDPRTSRFSWILRDSYGPLSTGNYGTSSGARIFGNGNDWIADTLPADKKAFWALSSNIANHPSGQQYYRDPDGVVRRGDGEERPEVPATDQVNPIYSGYSASAPYPLQGNRDDRPVILNRPFQSVGEMGYAFRDMPWKTLDFSTASSGDGALLDYFTIEETALDANRRPIKAGVVNPNTASAVVLEAILIGAARRELDNTFLSSSMAPSLASSIRTSVAANPLPSIASLPGLADGSSFPISSDKIMRKTEKESFLRALAPVAEVNVWNLMIDVIAQSGRFPLSATNLKDFAVSGESRYWIFAAIDRTTGQIIDIQYELVTE
jgi:hypothetical protein